MGQKLALVRGHLSRCWDINTPLSRSEPRIVSRIFQCCAWNGGVFWVCGDFIIYYGFYCKTPVKTHVLLQPSCAVSGEPSAQQQELLRATIPIPKLYFEGFTVGYRTIDLLKRPTHETQAAFPSLRDCSPPEYSIPALLQPGILLCQLDMDVLKTFPQL